MQRVDLPVARRQIALLGGLTVLPLLLAVAVAGGDPGTLASLGAITLILVLALVAMALRHHVEVRDDVLIFRHSVYSLRLPAQAIRSLRVAPVVRAEDLGITIRTNGIAAFGYLSGWFWNRSRDKLFCAVSAGRLYRLDLEGELKCHCVVFSAEPELMQAIEAW